MGCVQLLFIVCGAVADGHSRLDLYRRFHAQWSPQDAQSGWSRRLFFNDYLWSLFGIDRLAGWWLSECAFLSAYRETLSFVNEGLISLMASRETIEDAVLTPLGLRISRFLAFAYTYHYLNWFSKTSAIGWHRLKSAPLLKILGLWALCVAL